MDIGSAFYGFLETSPLSNWMSVFQLGCAMNFVMGGYSEYRASREREVIAQLTLAEEQLAEYHKAKSYDHNEDHSEIRKGLDQLFKKKATSLTNGELSRLRSEMTSRFYRSWYQNRRKDKRRIVYLAVLGFLSTALLFCGSIWPNLNLPNIVEVMIALPLIGTPLMIIFLVYLEVRQIEWLTQRPDRRKNKEGNDRPIRMRRHEREENSKTGRAQISYVTAHIARLNRGIRDDR